jgi:hypothetical protein
MTLTLREHKMVEGFWCIVVGDIKSQEGAGVVLLKDGKILGGDTNFYFIGSYQVTRGDQLHGSIRATNFGTSTNSRFGMIAHEASFDLSFEGTANPNGHIVAAIFLEEAGEKRQGLPIHLWKKADLP